MPAVEVCQHCGLKIDEPVDEYVIIGWPPNPAPRQIVHLACMPSHLNVPTPPEPAPSPIAEDSPKEPA